MPSTGLPPLPGLPALPGPLVDADWLAAHRGEVVVADVRWYLDGRSGREAHASGHVPGAVFVDLDRDLAAAATPEGGRHPLPSPAAFAATLGRLGLAAGPPVVAYDDAGGAMAARLWWMLSAIGRPVAVLDGGIGAWDRPLESGDVVPEPVAPPAPVPWPPERLADLEAVADLAAGAGLVLDARAPERYRGDPNAVDRRFGHVPGAVSAPFGDNLVAPGGRFRPPAELRARFEALGIRDGAGPLDVAVHCGSGVTACHDLLALEVAGLGAARARLFVGSWSAWEADPERPVRVGAEP